MFNANFFFDFLKKVEVEKVKEIVALKKSNVSMKCLTFKLRIPHEPFTTYHCLVFLKNYFIFFFIRTSFIQLFTISFHHDKDNLQPFQFQFDHLF